MRFARDANLFFCIKGFNVNSMWGLNRLLRLGENSVFWMEINPSSMCWRSKGFLRILFPNQKDLFI